MKADSDALKTVLETVPALSGKVFKGFTTPVGTKIAPPYIVMFPSAGSDTADRFTGPFVTRHPAFTLHVVGSSVDSAEIVFGNIKTALVVDGFMVPPTVDGRRNTAGYFDQPIPVQTSEDPSLNLAWAVVELGWTSEPA